MLQVAELEKPTPAEDEVLVKVQAVSLNASDWELLRGRPLYTRIFGLFKPRSKILGSDIAGTVEAVGANVRQFRPGDAVFGDIFERRGGFAEYVTAPARALLPKPPGLSFVQAAALPQAGVVALQGLRKHGAIKPGQRVLINGAGGGAGTFALQLAKLSGAEVTAVDSAQKFALLHSLGADHVIDYRQEDFAQCGRHYDFILDFVATRSLFACRRALAASGTYTFVGGTMGCLLQAVVLGPLLSLVGGRKLGILAHRPNTDDLASLAGLCESGKLVPVIDRQFSLLEVPVALRELGAGRALGKFVVLVAENGD